MTNGEQERRPTGPLVWGPDADQFLLDIGEDPSFPREVHNLALTVDALTRGLASPVLSIAVGPVPEARQTETSASSYTINFWQEENTRHLDLSRNRRSQLGTLVIPRTDIRRLTYLIAGDIEAVVTAEKPELPRTSAGEQQVSLSEKQASTELLNSPDHKHFRIDMTSGGRNARRGASFGFSSRARGLFDLDWIRYATNNPRDLLRVVKGINEFLQEPPRY